MTTVYARLQVRRDTSANWEAENPILAEGEIGFATDAKAEKIGDGVTPWNNLLSRPSQEQLLAVQAAAEIAAGDAQQRLDATVAAQTATETARDETQTLRDQTYGYKADVASAIVYQDLASIAEQKALTMVAGCVYDTRLDTDGGAWRDRCQGASWYNEELGTPTRGTRRDFPSVAVIIMEADKVWIFDGDDPSLPLWMEFVGNSFITWGATADDNLTCVGALNGKMVWGGRFNGRSGIVDFAADDVRLINSSAAYLYHRTVADRAIMEFDAEFGVGSGGDGIVIVDKSINDLAMTVLPDAPVDPATGLQVPTIAVATDGGVSVVTDSGDVFDSGFTTAASSVAFLDREVFAYGFFSASSVRVQNVSEISADGWNGFSYGELSIPALLGGNAKVASDKAIAGASGLSLLLRNDGTPSNGMVHYLTSTWISGWLPGDIRGAFLASNDQTDLVGEQTAVVFTEPSLQYTYNSAGSFDLQTMTLTSDGVATGSPGEVRAIWDGAGLLEVGKTYEVTVEVTSDPNGIAKGFFFGGTSYPGDTIPLGTPTIAKYASDYMRFGVKGDTAGSVQFSVTVWPVDEDRSVKGNGLIVKGTIARSVDTGGELAWYTPDTDLTVTLDSDISASGMVTWWETVGGVAHLYQKDLSGGQSYVDGKPGTPPADTITFAGADMTIKAGKTLKLVRPSATICSANQAAFMWQTERPIVIGGLPCTLYGTSDAVTALAHDPVTGLLHAGTSAGRSDFDGLARVGNTTTPVASAIAASGGMILEG